MSVTGSDDSGSINGHGRRRLDRRHRHRWRAVVPANLTGICVSVFHPRQRVRPAHGQAATDANGLYVAGLATGSYDVSFDSSGFCQNGSANGYVTQWWNNEPDQSSADAVGVTAGATTPSINAAMAQGGSIAGHITKADGRSDCRAFVSVFTHGGRFGQPHGRAATDANGLYDRGGWPRAAMT